MRKICGVLKDSRDEFIALNVNIFSLYLNLTPNILQNYSFIVAYIDGKEWQTSWYLPVTQLINQVFG